MHSLSTPLSLRISLTRTRQPEFGLRLGAVTVSSEMVISSLIFVKAPSPRAEWWPDILAIETSRGGVSWSPFVACTSGRGYFSSHCSKAIANHFALWIDLIELMDSIV
jgi:hypothetical protein